MSKKLNVHKFTKEEKSELEKAALYFGLGILAFTAIYFYFKSEVKTTMFNNLAYDIDEMGLTEAVARYAASKKF